MQLRSILSPGRTLYGAPGSSKKRALEHIAHFICEDNHYLNANELFDGLMARERLGSTGLGFGIAIPHSRLKNCASTVGTLIKLEQGIDFDSIDGDPVDLLFVLLVPEEAQDEHLNVLALLAERLSDPGFREQLRAATDDNSLYAAAISRDE